MRKLKQKIILLCVLVLGIISFFILKPSNKVIKNDPSPSETTGGMISVLVDGVEQSAFPSKGSAEYQSTSCTNGETAEWDPVNWKLSIKDISASTRCVVSFKTGGHNVYVSVSGGTVDSAPKNVAHNGNVTFTVAASNSNYVFSSAKCSGANGYSWANNVLSVNGVVSDAYCDVVFSRPTYTVYFTVVGGYTQDNYLTVVRGGGNSTTFGAVPGYLMSGSTIKCDSGITGKITGERIVLSNVLASGDCEITCAKDSSSYLPGGAVYNVGDEVSYANLAWLVAGSTADTVTLILKSNATYESTSSSNLTGTGIFGSGVTYTSSSARSYLVDIWLEQDAQKYLRTAIESEGLEYQEDANGYVRLPYITEVNTKLPNGSGTNFWTMDNDGNGHVYYGQPSGYGIEGKATDGKYYYEYYALATTTSVSYTNTTGCSGSGSGTSTQYYSTTCGEITRAKCTNATSYGEGSYSCSAGRCTSSGVGNWSWTTTDGTRYVSCAGYGTSGNYSANGCDTTCATSYALTGTWSGAKVSTAVTINPYSGSQSNGAYSNGYKKVVKNVLGSEVVSSTATKNTTLSYSTVTDGNNDMTSGIQAVTPVSSSARYNDSTPSSSVPTKTYTGSNATVASGTLSFSNVTLYQGSGTTSCAALKKTSTTAFSSGKITNPKCTAGYTQYTLNHNTQTMGYRPVIVVYKAN